MTTIDEINKDYRFEQILHFFNIIPDANNKILCPVHKEEVPSFQVNSDFGYCFGCKKSFNNFFMAKTLLEKRDKREYSYREVFEFFGAEKLPKPSASKYEEHKYIGAVSIELILYWESCMVDHSYEVLEKERKITRKTAEQYKIGWRPDYGAWVIPFWRGEPGNSFVDVVQFRLPTNKPKYVGLKNHNRGTIMNAHLLEVEQPYVAVLFGAFDAILAAQDKIIAVGTNGSAPFRNDEKKRVQKLFEKQSNVIVVPDNTTSEFAPAYKLAEWLNAQVRFFPKELPAGTDYIDFRRGGGWAMDFRQTVLELDFPYHIIENIVSLLEVGDPKNLARYHAWIGSKLYPPERLVNELDKYGPLQYTREEWNNMLLLLREAKDREHFFTQVSKVSQLAYEYNGGW